MDKYFSSQQDDEEVVLIIRKHWLHLMPQLILAGVIYLFGLFAALVLPLIFPVLVTGFSYNIYILVVSLLFLFNTTNLFSSWLLHYLNVGIVTTEHIVEICQTNLFSRKISGLGLDRIQDVSAEQKGLAETMFNYGSIDVQTAGELPNFLFTKVGKPNENAQKIMEIEEEFAKRHGFRNVNGQKSTNNQGQSEGSGQVQNIENQEIIEPPQIEYPDSSNMA